MNGVNLGIYISLASASVSLSSVQSGLNPWLRKSSNTPNYLIKYLMLQSYTAYKHLNLDVVKVPYDLILFVVV